MAFKFRDLVVTLVPGSRMDSGGSGGTVGSCTSECGHGGRGFACGLSDEFLDPLEKIIDPPFLVELRMLVRLAVARSYAAKVGALEATMQPKTIGEVDSLESQLKEALSELAEARKHLGVNPR